MAMLASIRTSRPRRPATTMPPGAWTVYGYTLVWVLGIVVPLIGVIIFSFLAHPGYPFSL